MVVAKLISIFVLAIFVRVDLYGIIRQVDKLVLSVAQLKFIATSPDIPLLVPVAFDLSV